MRIFISFGAAPVVGRAIFFKPSALCGGRLARCFASELWEFLIIIVSFVYSQLNKSYATAVHFMFSQSNCRFEEIRNGCKIYFCWSVARIHHTNCMCCSHIDLAALFLHSLVE